MASSIWTSEEFTCPGCGMDYSATREQHRHKHSGKFECRVCQTEVHTWSGAHDYFGWKTITRRQPVFGRKSA